jgi:hypothetical protein
MVFKLALAVLGAIVLFGAGLWVAGRREPVYAISDDEPAWFVAVKYKDGARSGEIGLAGGVVEKWSANADLTLIGPPETYWNRFLILGGGTRGQMPVVLSGAIEDAYVARVELLKPPSMLIGWFRALIWSGIWAKPQGEVTENAQALGFRPDVMPGPEGIAALMAKPVTYRPAMVNFLKYYDVARYEAKEGAAPGTGRAAYNRYGVVALQTVMQTGGELLFFGRVVEVLRAATAGPAIGAWDDIAAMQYSQPKSILTMEHVERYRAALKHRDAGLERTLVISASR